MSLKGSTREEMIWNFLKAKIDNDYGVAALMGNLEAESGLNPKNLENLCERRLKEAGKDYCTDETYTAAVDSGKISREEFLHPLPNKQYGYGLAQWTSAGRKGGLYDLAKSKGVSIGDLEMQLEYLCKELRESYKTVLSALKTAVSIRGASDVVLEKFERPADKSSAVKEKRAENGRKYYERYSRKSDEKKGENDMSIMVGSARIDEKGNVSGGAAGDQKQISSANDLTGEVSMQAMYVHSKGWYISRPKAAVHAAAMADLMKAACNNANIGYDQGNRLGVVQQGIMTAVKTECDCSSLVREVVKEATGKDPGNFNTANEVSCLEATGLFEKKVAYVSQGKTPVYNGDVLTTKTKGHTVIVVSGNARPGAAASSGSAGGTAVSTSKVESAKKFDKGLSGNYKATSDLHLRAGAGKEKSSLAIMPKGTTVRNYGYYTDAGGKKWLYVQTAVKGVAYTGFCSMANLEKQGV